LWGGTTLLLLAFVAALLALVADLTTFTNSVLQGSAIVNAVFVPLSLAAVGGLVVAVCAVLAWRYSWWSRAGRWHYTAIAIGAVLLFAVAHLYYLTTAPLGLLTWPNRRQVSE
jgi:hypothetical protein